MSGPTPFDADATLEVGVKLIEASAGTGKTYTITTLVVKLLVEEGVSITEILVVTFTEAATAELRDRVRSRVHAALLAYQGTPPGQDDWLQAFVEQRRDAGHAEQDVARLQQALAEFDQATIATIHGFCRRMLQENAFESGIRFDAELVTNMRELVEDVAADFWTAQMHGQTEDVYRYLVASKGKDLLHLQVTPESVRKLADRASGNREVRVLPDTAQADPVDTAEFAAAVQAVVDCWKAHGDEVRTLVDDACQAKLFNKPLRDEVPSAYQALDGWAAAPPTEPSFGLAESKALWLRTAKLVEQKSGTKKKIPLPEHDLFEALESLQQLLGAHSDWLASIAVGLNVDLIDYARDHVDERKQALGQQSFDDLLVLLNQALRDTATGPALSAAIRARYKAALIDEFQDTSPVQFGIFSRVFMDPALEGDEKPYVFLIGDPKQAIYAFRAADVYAYLRAAAGIGDENTIALGANWRTDDGLIRALGHVYAKQRHPDPFADARIQFVQVESRHDDRLTSPNQPLAPFRIRVPHTPPKTPKRGPARYSKDELRDQLATDVPNDVAQMLAQGVQIEGRDLLPGDMAILVRTNAQATRLQRELRKRRIPSVLHGSSSVFESHEAGELRLILRAVLEPSRVSSVRTALATDLLGLPASRLARLVEDPLGAAVPGDPRWDERVESFRALRTLWEERGIVHAIRQLFDEYEIQARALAQVGGERSMTNVLHLAELLHRAASAEQLGPQGLVRWLERQLAEDNNGESADAVQLRLESDDQSLQLITIHKSKGLEYPVVFCPYMWDGDLLRKWDGAYVRFHDPLQEEQLTLDVGSEDDAVRARSTELAEHELQAENARLLYVALTRAKHHCTVYLGPVKSNETSPLGYLLLGGADAGAIEGDTPEVSRQRLDAAAARIVGLGPVEVLDELQALAAAAPEGLISVDPIHGGQAPAYVPATVDDVELEARQLSLSLDWNWRSTSYSGLIQQRHESPAQLPDAAVDRDAEPDEDAAPPLPDASGDPIPLRSFPKGARCGNCLHKILELADFEALDTSDGQELVGKQLRAFGFQRDDWAKSLHTALLGALETPLEGMGGSLRLAALSRSSRLDELGFVFPVAGGLARGGKHMTVDALAGVFADHATAPVPPNYAASLRKLAFKPLQGFLGGFIDLVFEWEGRYYLADYKSNFLGETFGAYAPDHVQRVMGEHHYFLQYHLYTVALHRYLRWRIPDYSYEQHFGGAYYLFLRGMSAKTGPSTGVFHDRPPLALIEALDALLGGGK